ncbi:hypothetical protein JOC85_002965 [Bacillus mesophilus]|uniref:Uncharacterized protein n=1 Tax=Bacillus mesophilus TaxID=1808955 RepID=A0A6M0Q809_9BACI|nr:hypothetical protein [Bacillus mesophilus]MBM7662158.1 hypothetical protein [Bacillus mesophilus]NEY72491.1 hypothetical protein [Bacillus mesophilus]
MKSEKPTSELEEMYGLQHNQIIETLHIEAKQEFKQEGLDIKSTLEKVDKKQKYLNEVWINEITIIVNTFLNPFNLLLIVIAIYLYMEYKNNIYFNPVLPSLLFLFVLSDFFIRRNDQK